MSGLDSASEWPVDSYAVGWTSGRSTEHHLTEYRITEHKAGSSERSFPLMSVTKPLFAYAVLIAVEEGSLALDQPLGPVGSSVAHLLSHSSGLAPDWASESERDSFRDNPDQSSPMPVLANPSTRRIYSNVGFELLGFKLVEATGISVADYVNEAVALPLGLTNTTVPGSPAFGGHATLTDLLAFGRELLSPTLLSTETLGLARRSHGPHLAGVLPGFGQQDPNPWGLGFELRGEKSPHWTGPSNSAATFGHFGRSGTFLWVDPVAKRAAAALTNRDFGPWSKHAWPTLSEDILNAAT